MFRFYLTALRNLQQQNFRGGAFIVQFSLEFHKGNGWH